MGYMTAETAGEFWCPHATGPEGMGGVRGGRRCSNRLVHGTEPRKNCMCLGPRCSAWRWAEDKLHTEECALQISSSCDCNGEPARKAYCGLAGKPEHE